MAVGYWIIRASIFLNVAVILAVATIFYPHVVQGAADVIFYWQNDSALRTFSLYGLILGVATVLVWLTGWSVGRSAVSDYEAGL